MTEAEIKDAIAAFRANLGAIKKEHGPACAVAALAVTRIALRLLAANVRIDEAIDEAIRDTVAELKAYEPES